jgi:hypothetical protein
VNHQDRRLTGLDDGVGYRLLDVQRRAGGGRDVEPPSYQHVDTDGRPSVRRKPRQRDVPRCEHRAGREVVRGDRSTDVGRHPIARDDRARQLAVDANRDRHADIRGRDERRAGGLDADLAGRQPLVRHAVRGGHRPIGTRDDPVRDPVGDHRDLRPRDDLERLRAR